MCVGGGVEGIGVQLIKLINGPAVSQLRQMPARICARDHVVSLAYLLQMLLPPIKLIMYYSGSHMRVRVFHL